MISMADTQTIDSLVDLQGKATTAADSRPPGRHAQRVPPGNPDLVHIGSVALPGCVADDAVYNAEVEYAEDLTDLDWLAPVLTGCQVAHLGCGLGYTSVYLSSMVDHIVSHDQDARRVKVAKAAVALNSIGNSKIVDDMDSQHIESADVLLINTRRPIDQDHIAEIRRRPTSRVVILGPLSKGLTRLILDSGYEYCPEFNRGSVFQLPKQKC